MSLIITLILFGLLILIAIQHVRGNAAKQKKQASSTSKDSASSPPGDKPNDNGNR